MSVFSAMGYHGDTVKSSGGNPAKDDAPGFYPSEARFLRRASKVNEFFENSLSHLLENVTKLTPVMIGIQEFHPPTLDSIMEKLNSINPSYKAIPFRKEINNAAKVLTVYDSSKLGIISSENEYHEDLGETPDLGIGFTLTGGDKGRPISILFTDKGYTLINFHGINRPRLTDKPLDVADFLKPALEYHLGKAPFSEKVNLQKVIITCDSNDRGHKINMDSPLTLKGTSFHDGRKEGEGIKSCCYNYDSCGIDGTPENSKKPERMGAKGAESKYAYTGDYVLARSFTQAVTGVNSPQDADGASIASDHKLVYAIINLPANGGKRRKTQKKQRKQKKTRRVYKK